jgi:serine phosphatase RsbU (regulator of sigma subunit)
LAAATTRQDVIDAIFAGALHAVGAVGGALWLLNDSGTTLAWSGGAGSESSIEARFATIGMDSGMPGATVVATAEPLMYSNIAERDRRWPQLAGTPSSGQAVAVLPISVSGRTLGCLAVTFAAERDFEDGDLAFLTAIADQAAIAVDRSRLFEAEVESRRSLEYLARASELLIGSVEPRALLAELCRLAVPQLADVAAAYLPHGDLLDRVAVRSGGDPSAARALVGRYPVAVTSDSPLAVAYRTGTLQVVPAITEETVTASSSDPAFVQAIAGMGTRSGVAVPLVGPDQQVLAVVTLAFSDPGRDPSGVLLDVVQDLGRRAGAALAVAELYQRQRRIATTLTAAILPSEAASAPGMDAAALYVPVDPTAGDVGGDWFESWVLPDGRVLLGIGDVSGHGLAAATRMAQLRHAARSWALHDPDPASILSHLSRLAAAEGDDEHFATAVYAVLDPVSGVVAWANAGHPPPILAGTERSVLLEGLLGPPLGILPGATYEKQTVGLSAGEVLLLYTDGLVECTNAALDEGIERLLGESRRLINEAPLGTALCRDLMDACLAGRRHEDDCCVLAARVSAPRSPEPAGPSTPEARFELALEGEPRDARRARSFVADTLGTLGWEERCDDAVFLVSELIANVALHARTPCVVTIGPQGGAVRFGVRDASTVVPSVRHYDQAASTGRGLQLVENLAADWGVERLDDGKEVWFLLDR